MTERTPSLLRRLRLLRHLRARPRLWCSVAVGVVVALALPDALVRHAVMLANRAIVGTMACHENHPGNRSWMRPSVPATACRARRDDAAHCCAQGGATPHGALWVVLTGA